MKNNERNEIESLMDALGECAKKNNYNMMATLFREAGDGTLQNRIIYAGDLEGMIRCSVTMLQEIHKHTDVPYDLLMSTLSEILEQAKDESVGTIVWDQDEQDGQEN